MGCNCNKNKAKKGASWDRKTGLVHGTNNVYKTKNGYEQRDPKPKTRRKRK